MNKVIHLGNNVQVASNSMVNKTFQESNVVLAGMPAQIKKTGIKYWYTGWQAEQWHNQVEHLRKSLNINFIS